MSGFSAEWLALREPFDAAARSRELAQRFAAALPANPCIVDLGGGTGANVRYLAQLVGSGARWRIVDSDEELLAWAARQTASSVVEAQRYDLTGDLSPVLDVCDAVTTSALLDLCSGPWLDRLADAAATRHLPVLAVLSVDGRIEFSPIHPDDNLIVAAFAAHQRGDKGFGPALGAAASDHLASRLRALGYDVLQQDSDWRIDFSDRAMMREYLEGVIGAALEAWSSERVRINGWAAARRGQAQSGQLSVRVGHKDLLALYPTRRA
jgi:hypothetical protein